MTNNKYPTSWGKGEADYIVRSKYIGGEAKKANLDRWAKYAKDTSFDQSVSKRQSKRDLAPCGNHGREDDYGDMRVVSEDATYEGRGWKHHSEVSERNSYTKDGGSKRD